MAIMTNVTESRLIEIAARWEAMVDILKGEEVSDFMLSFPEVRQLADIMASQPAVEADGIIHCALCGFEIEPSNVICRDCLGGHNPTA